MYVVYSPDLCSVPHVSMLSVSVMQAGVTCTSFLTTQLESDIYGNLESENRGHTGGLRS